MNYKSTNYRIYPCATCKKRRKHTEVSYFDEKTKESVREITCNTCGEEITLTRKYGEYGAWTRKE